MSLRANPQPVSARRFKTVLLTCTTAFALTTAAGLTAPALAQDTPAPTAPAAAKADTTEVVVTGIRRGIQDAITAKKKSSSIIEAVSAEDIGKLPDNSIAESIARLPGVAAQRTNGRAQTLSIRGLGPDYTVTTFNGREQASTNDNRTVEYDQYPSELVSQVKIYKTPDASMSYQGIAGTADIETVHPLAYGKRAIALNFRHEENSEKSPVPGFDTAGDRYSFTYINQFANKTLGVAFGVAHNKTPYQAQTRESWGYADAPTGASYPGIAAGTIVNGGEKDGVQASYYERTGYLGVVEYKPNDSLHMVFDGYHSDFKELQTIRRLEFGTQWGSGALVPGSYTVDNGRVVSGTYTGATVIVENYNNQRDAKVDSFGWNTDYRIGDSWDLNSDISWSKVHRTDLRLESTGGTGPSGAVVTDTVKFTTNSDGVTLNSTAGNYGDFSKVFLTDPGGWGGGSRRSGFVGNPTVDDEIKAIRLAATRKLNGGAFSDVVFGVNYAERTKSKLQWQSILYLPAGTSAAVVPAAYRTGLTDSSFFNNANGIISYDALGLYRSGFWTTVDSRLDTNAGDGDRLFDITQSWTVREKLTTAYVKADIDSNFGGLPVTGNIGLQWQGADQQVTQGYSPGVDHTAGLTAQQSLPVSIQHLGTTYGDLLPSMNFNFQLADDTNLRVAAAVTEARPRLDDMAGGVTFSARTDSNPDTSSGTQRYWSGGGGNPDLHPWKANAVDLSLEKYFGRKGYVSVAVYYKDLVSYIYNNETLFDFSTLSNYSAPVDPAGCTNSCYVKARANTVGVLTVQANGHGGHVEGVEFSVSVPGDIVTPALDGFGVIFSAAHNDSEVSPQGTKIPLPGLSPNVVNTTLYYEKHGFSARVSNRYRGTWLGEVPNFDSSLGAHYVKSENLVDAQVGYEFREGALKGMSVNISGSNLTNEPFVLYDTKSDPSRVIKYEKYGATYTASIGYKF
ncbi:TonB-dependent receptor [Asticcacaulis solisilvae]|uniref:TonB-dependent receptor n=1 Tax=Asticcacaulis solisilvae TaxID=1217274 RepID=UPI003FD7B8B2